MIKKTDRIKRTIDQYNKIAVEYAQKIAGRNRPIETEKFVKLLKHGARILDIGCTAGRDTKILSSLGFDVIGVDLSEKLLEIAKQNNPDLQFVQADMRNLPFTGNSIDGIWANAVFHHLDKTDMIPTLNEFKRVLSLGGILYLRTKIGKGNWKGKDTLSVGVEREFTLLTPEKLDKMLTRVGFNKIELYTHKDFTRDINWVVGIYKKYFSMASDI